MKIFEFKESDIDAVFEIQQSAYKPLYEKYRDGEQSPYMESKQTVLEKYTRANTKGYIFVKDGITVGSVRIVFYPESNKARVSALGVLPEYQGQGIAQKALLEIEKIHGEVEAWFLDTILQEEGNCHLYEKLGYKKTGKTEKINDDMTLIFYEKRK